MNITLNDEGYTLDGTMRLVPVEITSEINAAIHSALMESLAATTFCREYAEAIKAAPNPPAEMAISGKPVAWRIDWPNGVTELGWYDDEYDPDNREVRGGDPIARPLYLHQNPPQSLSPWQPIATAPDDRPCIVGWVDLTNTDRYYFDTKQDGVWQDHDDSCEMAEACAPAGTVLPNRNPPYAYFIEIPPLPEPAP